MKKKKKRKKIIGICLAIIIIFFLAAIFIIQNYFGRIASYTIEQTLPKLTGAPAKLEDANFNLFKGEFSVNGFFLGNPEGFQTSSALESKMLRVKIDMTSLLSDTIKVNEIMIDGLEVTYEAGFPSNIGKIKENISSSETKEKQEEKDKKKKSKKIYIKEIRVINSKVKASVKGLGGAALPVPLPPILITDLGSEEQGITFTESLDIFFGKLLDSVTETASDTSVYVKDAAKKTSEKTKDVIDKVKNIFK